MAYEMQNRFLNKEVLELNQLRQQAIDRSALGPRKQWFIFFKQKNISSGGLHPQHFYFDMFPSSTLKIGEKYIYFIYLYTYSIISNLDNNACMVFSTLPYLPYYLTNWRKLYILIFFTRLKTLSTYFSRSSRLCLNSSHISLIAFLPIFLFLPNVSPELDKKKVVVVYFRRL